MMCNYESLPVVLVSAADDTAAAALIAEIIDNDVTESYYKIKNGSDRVWRIVNKYYTADVRVHALTDQQQLQLDPRNVEAHVVYLTRLECSAGGTAAVALATARQEGAGAAGRDAAVRLVAADCAAPGGELAAWAARCRREVVPLREAPAPAPAFPAAPPPFSEECGAERLRGALQAHAWRGLVRNRSTHATLPQQAATATAAAAAAGEADGSDEESEEARAVGRAEAFAAALALVEEARGTRDAADATERVERAEQVVAAFCRALGLDPERA